MAINYVQYNFITKALDKTTSYPGNSWPLKENHDWIAYDSSLINLSDCYDTLQPEMVNDQPIYEGEIVAYPGEEGMEGDVFSPQAPGETPEYYKLILVDGVMMMQKQSGWTQKEIFVIKVDPSKKASNEHIAAYEAYKAKRSKLLQESDFTSLNDCPFKAQNKAEWIAYRKALRNLRKIVTVNNASTVTINWPVKPIEDYEEEYK